MIRCTACTDFAADKEVFGSVERLRTFPRSWNGSTSGIGTGRKRVMGPTTRGLPDAAS